MLEVDQPLSRFIPVHRRVSVVYRPFSSVEVDLRLAAPHSFLISKQPIDWHISGRSLAKLGRYASLTLGDGTASHA